MKHCYPLGFILSVIGFRLASLAVIAHQRWVFDNAALVVTGPL